MGPCFRPLAEQASGPCHVRRFNARHFSTWYRVHCIPHGVYCLDRSLRHFSAFKLSKRSQPCAVPSPAIPATKPLGQDVASMSTKSWHQLRKRIAAHAALRNAQPAASSQSSSNSRRPLHQVWGCSGERTRTPNNRTRICCVAVYTTPEWVTRRD